MKRSLLLAALVIGLAHLAFGQATYENKQYRFAIEEPKDWILTDKAALIANIKRMDLDDDALAKILKNGNGTVLLAAYYKYDPRSRPGLIPTIKIQIRSKSPMTYSEFKRQIIQSNEGFKKFFDEYEITGQPQDLEISGLKGVLIASKFVLKTNDGQILKVRARTYAIPLKTYFFQLNFLDGDSEDCSSEFDHLVKTIKIGQ